VTALENKPRVLEMSEDLFGRRIDGEGPFQQSAGVLAQFGSQLSVIRQPFRRCCQAVIVSIQEAKTRLIVVYEIKKIVTRI
jgi:hypothetical protein